MTSIDVTLVDISSVCNNDSQHENLEQRLDKLFGSLTCCTAQAWIQVSESEQGNTCDHQSSMRQDILKFVKQRDQYTALASILLKSRAFHQVHQRNQQQCPLPLVDLPRTEHGKPYIPLGTNEHAEALMHGLHVISVSHQFPFVGLARLPLPYIEMSSKLEIFVGLDIVAFDEIRHNLYDNVYDFIQAFHDSFAPPEWEAMITMAQKQTNWKDSPCLLREFYLRWASKEAYTKALGIGLGFDFTSFEIVFEKVESESGLWHWLGDVSRRTNASPHGVNIRGTVVPINSNRNDHFALGVPTPSGQTWVFNFHLLWKNNDHCADSDIFSSAGCACTCWGPISIGAGSNTNTSHIEGVESHWMSLEELGMSHLKGEPP